MTISQKNYTKVSTAPQTHVRYNRVRRTWQSVNGTTTDHGSGPLGKRAAERTALAHDYPMLAGAVWCLEGHHNNDEQVTERLTKAARLIVAGLVFSGEVRSERDANRFYEVRFDGVPMTYSCTCEDFRSGRAPRSYSIGGRVCKHALAQHVSFLLGIELDAPPVPFDGETTNVDEFDAIWDGGTPADYDLFTEIEF